MLTFKQLVAELAKDDVALSSAEVQEMRVLFGEKVLQMGHLEDDGSLLVPVECVLEAATSLGARALTEAAEFMNNEQMVSMLRSGEVLVDRVIEAREKRLRRMIRQFQEEPDSVQSHRHWKQIEKEVFGAEYND